VKVWWKTSGIALKWRLVMGGNLWWGSWGYVGVANWNEGTTMVICEGNRLWQYALHYCYYLVYNMSKHTNLGSTLLCTGVLEEGHVLNLGLSLELMH
jgi:hypothetical protein